MKSKASLMYGGIPGGTTTRRRRQPRRRGAVLIPVVESLEQRRLLADTPEVEPNDTIAQATVLPIVEDPVGSGFYTSNRALGSIDPAGDSDYWSFNAHAGDQASFELDRTSGGDGQRIIIYNAAGSAIFDTTTGGYSWFGSPQKTVIPVFTIPADGTYYARMLNWPGYSGSWAYQFRIDLGHSVQLEPYDWNFSNDSIAGANALTYNAGSPGHLVASVAGSLYSQEGTDYYSLGRLDPGNAIAVSSRLISVSSLGYRLQVVGKTVGVLPDQDGSDQDAQVTATITQSDDYYLQVAALSGTGIRGQYLLDLDVQDNVPPRINSLSGIPLEGGNLGLFINPISATFSEDLQTAGVNSASTYELRSAGPDNTFNTSDDVLYTLSPSGDSRSVSIRVSDGPLQPGLYRFTAHATGLLDRVGNALDGNSDGIGGDDRVQTFVVSIPLDDAIENRENDDLASATALPMKEDPPGSGFLTSSIAVGSIDPSSDTDFWSFSAHAGDQASFELDRTSGGDGQRIIIYNAAGSAIFDTTTGGYSWFGSPQKTVAPAFTIPADGTYYARMLNWPGYTGSWAYQFRMDLSHSVQLEPYDWNFSNDSIAGANALTYNAGSPGHLVASVAGSLYSQEGTDYYSLGRLDPGNAVVVSSRLISLSSLGYDVQIIGKTVGLLPDSDGNQLDNKASATITQSDDYYLQVAALSGTGIRGQYLLDLDVQDNVPPRINSISGIPAEAGTIGLFLNPISAVFSEDLQTAGVNSASTYELRSAGPDNTFNTPDDALYTLSPSGDSRSVSIRVTDGPLQPGLYRFTAHAAGLLDRFGNPLDGNVDGSGGDDLIRGFSVVIPQGQVIENRSNDSIPAATPLAMIEDPPGSGFLTSSIAVGSIDPSGDTDFWSFSAHAGDQASFELDRTSGGDGQRIIIYNAAGSAIFDTTTGGYSWFGSPQKTVAPAFTIPADGTYYARMLNWPGYSGSWAYQFRMDLSHSVQLEPYDWNFSNDSIAGANALTYNAGSPGHLVASVAGSLYSQEGTDYYSLGRLDPGNAVVVSSRLISLSSLGYDVQIIGKTVGLLPDSDGNQLDNKASATITQSDDYYLQVAALSGTGIRGQYLLDLDVQDNVPPRINSISGIPAEAGTIGLFLNPISAVFSEDLQTAGVNSASTYELRSAGPDNTFNTPDDALYTLSPSGDSRSVSIRVTDGPLQPGLYRFTAHAAGLLDRFGNPLDGNVDGSGGDDLIRGFSVVIPQGQVIENRSNDSIPAATPLAMIEDPPGSGFLTSSIAVGSIDPSSDTDFWSFSAHAGDQASFELDRTSGGDGQRIIIYNAAGSAIFDTTTGGYSWFGSPQKTVAPAFTIPADGTYYARMLNWPGYTGSWAYQFRIDLGHSVQLEPYDWNFSNDSIAGANALTYNAGSPGHLVASVAGSLYSQEGTDYYSLGRLDPGNAIAVSSRLISVSSLGYRLQVVGKTVGVLPDQDGSDQDAQVTATITQSDDYYLQVAALSGTGIRGQYLLDLDVQDNVPPRINSLSGIPLEGGNLGLFINPISATFSEDLQTAGVNSASTYELRSAGPDNTFNTSDDVLYTLSPSGDSRSVSIRVSDGPLQPGLYRFTAHATGLLDRVGNALDGNSDGIGGDDRVQTFVVSIPLDDAIENRENDDLASATALPMKEDPPGSGFLTSSIAVGSIDPSSDTDFWSFSAHAGDQASFELDRTSGGDGQRIIIYNAAGSAIFDTTTGGYSWFGSPQKTVAPAFTIPADGTYYARMLNWPGYTGSWAYQFRMDLSHSVQLEPYDWNFSNDSIAGANALTYNAGSPGHLVASVAGSLYSQEGTDYYSLGRLDPGNAVVVSSRLISLSSLGYDVQIIGKTVGLLPDSDGNQLDNKASATITQSDDYYLQVAALSGTGIRGQYLLDLDVQDNVPPRINSISGIPAEAGTVGLFLNPISAVFSEDLQTAGVNSASTYELRSAGPDNTFNTPDDALYTLSPSGDSRSVSIRVTDGPLQPGLYRFTAHAAGLLDRFGNPLDGNVDGSGGDDLIRGFSVVIPQGQVIENRSNDSIPAATPLAMIEDPPGSGFLTSSIAVGSIDPSGDTDFWSFSAHAGDQASFELDRTSGGDGQRIIIYNAAGSAIFDTTTGGYSWFGSPQKTVAPAFTIPADGTYYARMLNWPGYTGSWAYQFRMDLSHSVQLEPYDWNFSNDSIAGANALTYNAGSPGHLVASVAGSLYSQEGTDYYSLGRLDPGNAVVVSSRLISLSSLGYDVQIIGKTVGLLPDSDGNQLDNKASATITQSDDYYLQVAALSGTGIRGQYLLDLDVQDNVPPRINSISGIPAEAGTIGLFLNPISAVFSEDLQTAGVNSASTYELRSAGPDNTFNTSDDVLYTLSPSGDSRSVTLRVTDGPLQPGNYRLTARASGLDDRVGNALDGDADGTGGDDLVRNFSVVIPSGEVIENRNNDTLATATALPQTEDPPGSGFFTSSIALGSIDPSGDTDFWSFSAHAGDQASFELDRTSGGDGQRIIIYNTAGSAIFDTTTGGYSWFGSPQKTVVPVFTIPADGTYYARMLNWPGYSGSWAYQFRIDIARSVELESYDWNFSNNSIGGANNFPLTVSGDSRFGTIAGNLYSQDGVDYYNIGTVNPGETILVSTRLPSNSTLSPAVEVHDDRDFYWNETSGNRSFDGVAEVAVTEKHTFYVLIRPNSGAGIRGQYLLDVQVVPTGSLDFPDLVATVLTGPNKAQSGDTVTLGWTVENIGSAATLVGTWSDSIFLSQDDNLSSDDLFLGSFSHDGALAVSDTYQQSQTVHLPDGISGNYKFLVQVDSGNAVNEFVLEGNNVTASDPATQVSLAPYADFKPENLSITGPNNDGTFSFSWTTANQGTLAVTGSWEEHVSIRNTTTGLIVLDKTLDDSGGLPVNGTVTESVPFAVTGAGHFVATITTDSQNSYYEWNTDGHDAAEQNNTAQTAYDATLDLQVTNLVTNPDTGLASGSAVTVLWEVANNGNQPVTTSFSERVVIKNTSTGQTLASQSVPYNATVGGTGPIPAGESRPRQFTFTLPDGLAGVGQIEFDVTTDENNAIVEYNTVGTAESNNTAQVTRTSILGDAPDLQVENITLDPATGLESGAARPCGGMMPTPA